MNPLEIITSAGFTPLSPGDKDLTIKNFVNLDQLSLKYGDEIELEGYVTYVSKVHKGNGTENDQDVHFNISPTLDGIQYLVCEIQNADEKLHKRPLDSTKKKFSQIKVKGIFRMFLEHIYESAQINQFPHIFEIHPVNSINIKGKNLKGITMDCPEMSNWRNNNSIYEMRLNDNGVVDFKKLGNSWKSFDEGSIYAEFDGTDLVLKNVHTVGHNYIFMQGHFSKTEDFNEGDPYSFELVSPDNDAVKIKSLVIPDTPAYDVIRNNQDFSNLITVVAIRTLDIQQLFDSKYETILCPVFRIEF